jgi:hypothetical protein
MSVRSGSGSQSRRSGRCSPAKQRHCLYCAAPPPRRDASCSSGCLLRRRKCEIGPRAAVGMVLNTSISIPSKQSKQSKANLTLLRRPTQHARKRRTLTPNALHARIVFLAPLQSSNALPVLRLHLLDANDIGLRAPRFVVATVWSESLALRIHRSCEPSESPVQTLSSRLRPRPLLAFLFFKARWLFTLTPLLARPPGPVRWPPLIVR